MCPLNAIALHAIATTSMAWPDCGYYHGANFWNGFLRFFNISTCTIVQLLLHTSSAFDDEGAHTFAPFPNAL